MAKSTVIISESNLQNILYKNAQIIKVHEEGIYDIKFTSGKIRTYVENTSGLSFNSGDYVAVLISENSQNNDNEICKIISKGRKIQQPGTIPIVRV